MQIKIPFLAEGVESGTVVSILVREGDQIKKDQTVLELDTNKATAPIPAPASGKVTKILVKEGQEVSVGQLVINVEESSGRIPQEKEPAPARREVKGVPEIKVEDYSYESKSGLPPPAAGRVAGG